MVPQPTHTLDLDRKEELIIQKQIRQSTTRMIKQNLPTLIEASPDFNQKKLPYLPNLPASVQIGDIPNTHTWFDQYQDNAESVTTEDIPSLYSVTQKRRNPHKSPSQYDVNGNNRPDSRRSASITFDIDDDIHKVNRTRSKEKKESKQESHPKKYAKEEYNTMQKTKEKKKESHSFHDTNQEVSMWACKKCTLDNPLQEATCLACGGSRLSSLGDIELPKILEPKDVINLIVGNDKYLPETMINGETENDAKWKCIICTFENYSFTNHCNACNYQKIEQAEETVDLDFKDVPSRFARFFGIACFLSIIIYSLINMIVCLYSTMQTIKVIVPEYTPFIEYKPSTTFSTDIQEEKIEDAEEENDSEYISYIERIFSFDIFGVKPVIMSIFCPIFLYLATCVGNV